MKLQIVIGQFPISFNIEENFNNIKKILDKSNKEDLVILPEGAISGYNDDISFLKNFMLAMSIWAIGIMALIAYASDMVSNMWISVITVFGLVILWFLGSTFIIVHFLKKNTR